MSDLYPLKFKTIFKEKIWGGDKIRTYLNKDFSPLSNCGETWEISGVSGNVSIIQNGNLIGKSLSSIIEAFKGELLGEKVYERFGNEFPLLVKFIDAADDLSIQVHPNDEVAQKLHHSKGKTEMWYVIQADENAKLVSGFNASINEEIYLNHLNSGNLSNILNTELAKQGDVFFLPAGRVHYIGKGLLIAEIQQTSDITYRIFDFDRKDDNGNLRVLHTEQALKVLDFDFHDDYKTEYVSALNESIEIVNCEYFTTQILTIDKEYTFSYSDLASFVILIGVSGISNVTFGDQIISLNLGECILLPASCKTVTFHPNGLCKILLSYIVNK
jgi:mannose-6-phosphate isomerase